MAILELDEPYLETRMSLGVTAISFVIGILDK